MENTMVVGIEIMMMMIELKNLLDDPTVKWFTIVVTGSIPSRTKFL